MVLIKSGSMSLAGLMSWPELTLFLPLRISQKASSVWPNVIGMVSNLGNERWLSFMMLTMHEWSCSQMVEEGMAWRVIVLVRLLHCKIVKKLCRLSCMIHICGLSQMSTFSVDSGYKFMISQVTIGKPHLDSLNKAERTVNIGCWPMHFQMN